MNKAVNQRNKALLLVGFVSDIINTLTFLHNPAGRFHIVGLCVKPFQLKCRLQAVHC